MKKSKKSNKEEFNIKNHVQIIDYPYKNNKNLSNFFRKPIGLYDPLGKNINPLTNQPYQNLYKDNIDRYESGPLAGKGYRRTYANLSYIWTNQIMYSHITDIMKSIQKNQITMIKAGTGVGKTLLTPKVALQAFQFQKNVICTVPKRALARKNAGFSAQCLDVFLGKEVGYFFSGEKKKTDDTKLVFTTSGSLKSLVTGSEPLLNDYQCVLIDEVHERSIDTDFLMLMMKEILDKRPDFRLVLMSATVDVSKFKEYFNKFTFQEIIVEGKIHDVKEFYKKKPLRDWKEVAIQKTIHLLQTSDDGDILIFIKAGNEGYFIKQGLEMKIKHLKEVNPFIVILESKTSSDDQDYATDKFKYLEHPDNDPENPFHRKVVIATNVAESSLTIDGVVYVIDNGYEIESAYYPRENARSLLEERISKASAKQRKGRAGRTKPGECFRLYTKEEYEKFHEYSTPEIQKTDITSDLLDLFKLPYIKNIKSIKQYMNTLMDPPKDSFIVSSMLKLHALGAVDSSLEKGTMTPLGNVMSKFRKFESHTSKAILASVKLNCMYEVIHIVLICFTIDNRMESIFQKYRPSKRNLSNAEKKKEENELIKKQHHFYSTYGDLITLHNIYSELKEYMFQFMKQNNIEEGETDHEYNENNNLTPSKKKCIKEAQRWCYEHGINAKPFIDKGSSGKSWDKVRMETRLITQIINDELKRSDINKVNQKNYKLFNLIHSNEMKEKNLNIILSFCVGGITNIASLYDKKNKIYRTCFPEEKKLCKIDRNSSISSPTQFILYNELFMSNKKSSVLKLNIVSKIPNDVLRVMKKYYDVYYQKCMKR